MERVIVKVITKELEKVAERLGVQIFNGIQIDREQLKLVILGYLREDLSKKELIKNFPQVKQIIEELPEIIAEIKPLKMDF